MATVLWSVALFAAALGGIGLAWLLDQSCQRAEEREELQSRRSATPQRGAAKGTGVEQTRGGAVRGCVVLLPRSPIASTGAGNPRLPVPVGPQAPVAASTILGVATGLQTPARKRVVLHE